MKPIRLLLIGHSYVLAVNRATAREVAQDPSFEITVAAPSYFHGDLRPVECEPEPAGSRLKLVKLPARFTKRIHIFRYEKSALSRLIIDGDFDGVHAWEEPYIYAGYQIAKFARKSRARFCFRTAQSLNKRYPPPFNLFEKTSLNAADRWIAGGSMVFENLVARGYPRHRGRVITLAVDDAMFRPVEVNGREPVLRELGLTPPVIGFVGRLTEAKGLSILTKALEELDPALPWSLLLLGSGELKPQIEQWAAQRGWSSRVRIHLAKHDEVPRFLATMDLMVAPSQTMANWKEQFGRMLIEAFACGVPVIGSDSGEIPHVIGDCGLIVGEKDVSGWRSSIEILLRSEERRKELASAGISRATRYSVREVAQQFREFYRDLIAA